MSQPVPALTPNIRARGNPNKNNPLTQNTVNDSGLIRPAISTVTDEKKEDLIGWVNSIYDTSDVTEDIIKSMIEAFSYKGFNREDVLKQLHVIAGDKRTVIDLIVVTALRGPQAASRIKLTNGKTPIEMGIPASGAQGTKVLTLNKIVSATADLAAFFLKSMNVPKRMISELPGWLQFPSAGGIKLPERYRSLHYEFANKFSAMIGGQFQEQIYYQMQINAYLDERLGLF
jgi:hypothetical protein